MFSYDRLRMGDFLKACFHGTNYLSTSMAANFLEHVSKTCADFTGDVVLLLPHDGNI